MTVQIERPEPHLAELVMNRPEALNALSTEQARRLTAALADVAADDQVGVVILASALAVVMAEGMGSSPGGAANMAVAAARLGLTTGLAAVFGSDVYGDYCWSTLEEDEVGERGCVVRISSGSSLAFSVLERVLILPIEAEGQAIAWDRSAPGRPASWSTIQSRSAWRRCSRRAS